MKDFIIIGVKAALTYQEVFPLIKERKMWVGRTNPGEFHTATGTTQNMCGLTRWFSNVGEPKVKLIKNRKKYQGGYPKIDNFPAIEVGKVRDIPDGYEGLMAVPVTFLEWLVPGYEIVGILKGDYTKLDDVVIGHTPVVEGVRKFSRVVIRAVQSADIENS